MMLKVLTFFSQEVYYLTTSLLILLRRADVLGNSESIYAPLSKHTASMGLRNNQLLPF